MGFRVEDLEDSSSNSPKVIDELRRHPGAGPLHQAHEYTHAIAEQGRVGGVVDVGVDHGAVDANLRAALDFPIDGFADEHPVDHLEGRWPGCVSCWPGASSASAASDRFQGDRNGDR